MLKKSGVGLAMIFIGVLSPCGAMQSIAVAQQTAAPNPQANVALGEGEVKKLLPLMNSDNDGQVSKREFMSFMEAEFDRLDQKREGKLDVKELAQPPPTRGFHK